MGLKNISEILDKAGWDTSRAGNLLSARKEEGDVVIEITIDQSGGCLVRKSVRSAEKTKLVNLLGRNINVIMQNPKTAQMRIKLQSEAELAELLKAVDKL